MNERQHIHGSMIGSWNLLELKEWLRELLLKRLVENSVAKEFLMNFTTTSRKSAGPCRTCSAALKDGGRNPVNYYKKRERFPAFLLCAILRAGGFSRPKKKHTGAEI